MHAHERDGIRIAVRWLRGRIDRWQEIATASRPKCGRIAYGFGEILPGTLMAAGNWMMGRYEYHEYKCIHVLRVRVCTTFTLRISHSHSHYTLTYQLHPFATRQILYIAAGLIRSAAVRKEIRMSHRPRIPVQMAIGVNHVHKVRIAEVQARQRLGRCEKRKSRIQTYIRDICVIPL